MTLDDYGSPAWAWKRDQFRLMRERGEEAPMNLEEFNDFLRRLFMMGAPPPSPSEEARLLGRREPA